MKGKLLTRSLLLRPAYETVSYCWNAYPTGQGPGGTAGENEWRRISGPRPQTATVAGVVEGHVVINGQTMDVPRSSELALRAVRLSTRSRVVWIDSICINQEDLHEKASQVANMDIVYSKGKCNIVYLGEDIDGIAEQQVANLKVITAAIETAKQVLPKNARNWVGKKLPDTWKGSALVTNEMWYNMKPLLKMHWFTYVQSLAIKTLPMLTLC